MEILISAENSAGMVAQINEHIGGEITERWGEHVLTVDNEVGRGTIRFIGFDWGVNLIEYDILFNQDITMIMDTSEYNPIQFIYCLEGYFEHRSESDIDKRKAERFQSVIITNTDGGYVYRYFPRDTKLEINNIQIVRKLFLKKRLNIATMMNQKLYRVFVDTDHQRAFSYFGSYNLKLADKIAALRKVKEKGMVRILMIEGLVYQILSMHLMQHDKETKAKKVDTSLLKRELAIIRKLARKIAKDVAKPYSLESLSLETGLTQAKLQEGFKLLYSKTVTEYIRNVRLEAARDYMVTTDMNISEIVYTIGFSSRSYFSKIFREKFGISPSAFMKQQVKTLKDLGIEKERTI
ncbi:MAG: AraC family transcriptional regulator [Muricauda sp.]|nr:helix-turn-helix transcriptional regulator [Allomuricauda sp.]MBC31800.1 AraC family transcriptional regulator [Allomuricauda sp.]|tara:strand:+ start:970 stop:2022 length:1053 start_codon:yes stop_codon:yes gene_type:complete